MLSSNSQFFSITASNYCRKHVCVGCYSILPAWMVTSTSPKWCSVINSLSRDICCIRRSALWRTVSICIWLWIWQMFWRESFYFKNKNEATLGVHGKSFVFLSTSLPFQELFLRQDAVVLQTNVETSGRGKYCILIFKFINMTVTSSSALKFPKYFPYKSHLGNRGNLSSEAASPNSI